MSVPNTSELDDDQIEALIRKLSAIKGSAPELIAALETEANSRLSKQSGGRTGSGRSGGNRGQQQQQRQANTSGSRRRAQPQPAYEEEEDDEEEEEEDDDDDDEETDSEDDDEFDEDGPCVGEGYSDEVSVISEMTTPTVVSAMSVAEEERYQELNRNRGKSNKPDLLSQVNRVNAAKQKANKNHAQPVASSGGLNPARRQTYTSGLAAMAKISETTEAAAVSRPKTATLRQPAAASGSKKASRKTSGDGTAPRKTNRGLRRDQSPAAQREKAGTGTKKKSSSNPKTSGTSKKSSSRQRQGASSGSGNNAFSDEWQKSLSAGDFTNGAGTDDTGFPFSFGDDADNAFGGSGTNFFKDTSKKSNATGHSRGSNNSNSNLSNSKNEDAFDPFGSADPFATARSTFESPSSGNGRTKSSAKARPTNSRPRRTSVSKLTTKR